jgi:flavin reductase (DIM6/NTAB) family NADH-FMN oxidoreductase RutF
LTTRGPDRDTFLTALGRFGSGVTVITVRTKPSTDYGMTASAFSSLSLDPPLVMVAVKTESRMRAQLEAAPGFAVNVLSEHQDALSDRFAGRMVRGGEWVRWPEDRDKFEDLAFSRGAASGAALLEGCLAGLDCSHHSAQGGGDHTIFVARVDGIRLSDSATPLRPLLYFASGYRSMVPAPGAAVETGLRLLDWLD